MACLYVLKDKIAIRHEAEANMDVSPSGVMYYFTITTPGFDPDLVKALVIMAVKETDLIFGPARRKLETEYRLFRSEPACAIAGGTECGEHLARLFSGFLIKQLGEDGFVVERLDRSEGRGRRHEAP